MQPSLLEIQSQKLSSLFFQKQMRIGYVVHKLHLKLHWYKSFGENVTKSVQPPNVNEHLNFRFYHTVFAHNLYFPICLSATIRTTQAGSLLLNTFWETLTALKFTTWTQRVKV